MSIDPQQARRAAQAARRVDPHLMFGISLLVALAVSWPALSGAMHGTFDIVQAGIHLLVAMAISWAGCYAVGSLVYGYAQSAASGHEPTAVPDAVSAQRRAGDVANVALLAPASAVGDSTADAA